LGWQKSLRKRAQRSETSLLKAVEDDVTNRAFTTPPNEAVLCGFMFCSCRNTAPLTTCSVQSSRCKRTPMLEPVLSCGRRLAATHGMVRHQQSAEQQLCNLDTAKIIADDPQLRLTEPLLPVAVALHGFVAARPSRTTYPLLKLHFGFVAAAGHATGRSVTNYVHSNCRCIR
jgi:hypothetical protein